MIVPAYTYTASASAAIHCGAKVIFVDSQKDNCEMDYDKVAEAITEKTKAVVAVDLGGVICDYDKLYQAIESKKNLFTPRNDNTLGSRIQKTLNRVMVFADCAHALGAVRKGKMAGEWADFSSFSFHAVKNFTTAEGGASTWKDIPGIDNEEVYKLFQLYSLHGQNKDALAKTQLGAWEYDIIGPWYKCNMTDIMAAIGLRQLDRYPGMLARRREIVSKYDEMGNKLLIVASERYGDYVKEIAESMECFETISFVDNDREDAIGRLDELSSFYPEYNCAIAACDDGEERLMWNKKLEELFNIPVLFHKDSTISPSSSLLSGSIVEPRAVIGCQITIGSSTVVGAGTVVEPYCIIGEGSTLKSGTIVKSTSIVEKNTVTDQGTVLYVEDKKGE